MGAQYSEATVSSEGSDQAHRAWIGTCWRAPVLANPMPRLGRTNPSVGSEQLDVLRIRVGRRVYNQSEYEDSARQNQLRNQPQNQPQNQP